MILTGTSLISIRWGSLVFFFCSMGMLFVLAPPTVDQPNCVPLFLSWRLLFLSNSIHLGVSGTYNLDASIFFTQRKDIDESVVLTSLVVWEMMRIPIVCSLYRIPFQRSAICWHLHNMVYCIHASSFPSSQNEVHVAEIPVVPRWLSTLQLHCNVHINCSRMLFYCYNSTW